MNQLSSVKISIDIGYGYTKGVVNGKQVGFPSLIAPYEVGPFDDTNEMFDTSINYRTSIRTGSVIADKIVGDAARRSSSAQRMAGDEKPSEMHDILMLTCIALLLDGQPSEVKIDLALGLPLSYYRSQKGKLQKRISCMAGRVRVNGQPERHISFSSVNIYPQGMGAIIAAGIKPPTDGYIGLIDLGTYTTDFLLLEFEDGRSFPVNECCRSISVGIEQIYKALDAEFQKLTGRVLPPRMYQQTLDKTVKNQPIAHSTGNLDLSDALQKGKEEVSEAIASYIQSNWGDRVQFLQETILAGGGAQYFIDKLRESMPHVTVVSDPIFANAQGYYKMIQQQLKLVKAVG